MLSGFLDVFYWKVFKLSNPFFFPAQTGETPNLNLNFWGSSLGGPKHNLIKLGIKNFYFLSKKKIKWFFSARVFVYLFSFSLPKKFCHFFFLEKKFSPQKIWKPFFFFIKLKKNKTYWPWLVLFFLTFLIFNCILGQGSLLLKMGGGKRFEKRGKKIPLRKIFLEGNPSFWYLFFYFLCLA